MVECFKNLLQILWVNVKQTWYNHPLEKDFQFFQIKGQVHFIGELVRKEWKLALVFLKIFFSITFGPMSDKLGFQKKPPKNNPEIQTNMHWLMTDAIHTQYKTLIWQNTTVNKFLIWLHEQNSFLQLLNTFSHYIHTQLPVKLKDENF